MRARGQDRALALLRGLLSTGRIPSTLLFTGIDGVGKTMTAYDFARALICPGQPLTAFHPDIKAVNAAAQAALREEEPAKQKTLRVETIRHVRRDMEMRSLLGDWKAAVIEDAHTLEIEAANALLKILEEPPLKTLWILVTSQKDRLPKTVLSRCSTVSFRPLPARIVEEILHERGIAAPRAAELSALCEGSVSRALELEKSPSYPGSLTDGPLSAMAAADALPKELYLARAQAELALFSLAQDLRLKHLRGEAAFSQVEQPLKEIVALRQALRANADPRIILTLAALEAEGKA